MAADRVDRLVDDVTRLHPELDAETKAIGARLLHLSDLVQRRYAAVCSELGLSLVAHSVLTTLLRRDPEALTLARINDDAMVTSGGITFVVDQLQKQGLVRRKAHPEDRRATLVSLTAKGRRLADEVVVAIAEVDDSVVSLVGVRDRRLIQRIFRCLECGIEASSTDGGTQEVEAFV